VFNYQLSIFNFQIIFPLKEPACRQTRQAGCRQESSSGEKAQNFSLKLKILKVLTFSSEGACLPAGRDPLQRRAGAFGGDL